MPRREQAVGQNASYCPLGKADASLVARKRLLCRRSHTTIRWQSGHFSNNYVPFCGAKLPRGTRKCFASSRPPASLYIAPPSPDPRQTAASFMPRAGRPKSPVSPPYRPRTESGECCGWPPRCVPVRPGASTPGPPGPPRARRWRPPPGRP